MMRIPTLILWLTCSSALALAAQQPSALKIVVVEGEGGVNIIQQKTAVRPLVEVRDRNNLPVPGAAVTFTIGGNNAVFAGGVHTLTLTTNAAGQAAASSLNAISSGAFQIQVSAAYQGQIATAAISQTNFATAAAAAQAGASTASGAGAGGGGSTSAAGGAAGGGGGGISGTTLGIIGAAVGGGAIAATQVVKKEDGGGDTNSITSYTGSFSSSITRTISTFGGTTSTTCTYTSAFNGTMTIRIAPPGDKDVSHAEIRGNETETSRSGGGTCNTQPFNAPISWNIPVTGPESALAFSQSTTNTSTQPATVTVTDTMAFTGALSGNTITGTLGYKTVQSGTSASPGSTITGEGATSFPVTLQKQ